MPGGFDQAALEHQFETIRERLRAIEAQLSVLSAQAGVPYVNPSAEVPSEVVELVKAGKRLDAVKKYRELTGAGSSEAQAAIDAI